MSMQNHFNLTILLLCLSFFATGFSAKTPDKTADAQQSATTQNVQKKTEAKVDSAKLTETCITSLKALPGRTNPEALKAVCETVKLIEGCNSVDGQPIYHFDKLAANNPDAQRIFVMALIHGDEVPSGSVARSWMERLHTLDPRNHWRVVPVASPDGLKKGTRTNTRGVDLNRNFPSIDWEKSALYKWRSVNKADPRRYPGPTAASEPETHCYLKHITEFKPDLVISIHTPLAVLDFDGPQIQFPKTETQLKWRSIGTYPGSLGQFLWKDQKIPVLTVELTPDGNVNELEKFDQLQDVSGKLAKQVSEKLKRSPSQNK